jgi:hypothetical protein
MTDYKRRKGFCSLSRFITGYLSASVLTRFVNVLVIVCLLAGCNRKDAGQKQEEKAIARIDEATLSRSEIAGIIPKGTSPADSSALVSRYLDAWVKKQLKLEQAREQILPEQTDIERRVDEYREALLLHEYEKQYIQEHLDTTVNEGEIKSYYTGNLANFELKQSIVQGRLAAIPKDAPKLDQARQWMRSGNSSDQQEFRSYCYRFARFYHLDDSLWVPFTELVRNTPFKEVPNEVQFLKQNNFSETSDEQNVYWLVVKQFKLSSQPSPLAFVHNQIRDMVINQRKQKLMQNLEKNMYEEARKKKRIEIYPN